MKLYCDNWHGRYIHCRAPTQAVTFRKYLRAVQPFANSVNMIRGAIDNIVRVSSPRCIAYDGVVLTLIRLFRDATYTRIAYHFVGTVHVETCNCLSVHWLYWSTLVFLFSVSWPCWSTLAPTTVFTGAKPTQELQTFSRKGRPTFFAHNLQFHYLASMTMILW